MLRGCDRWLVRLMLLRWWRPKYRRVLADVVDEWREGRMTEESLDQSSVTLILLQQGGVLATEVGILLRLQGDFAFELANVLCITSVVGAIVPLDGHAYLSFEI